jgi:hypothetical protein
LHPDLAKLLARGKEPEPVPVGKTAMDFIVNRKLEAAPEQESEITRICSIPIAVPLDAEEIEAINRIHIKPKAYEAGFRFKKVQAEAIHAFQEHGALFGSIEVGGGKELICLRSVGIAAENGAQRIMLCTPSNVVIQLVEHDIAWARQRVPLGCTFYNMNGLSPQKRREMSGGRRGCWVVPYSLLSTEDSSEMLERIRPEVIILNEAHNLKHRDAARTKRILTYCRHYRPRLVVVSGTASSKSIKEIAHLLMFCLGKNSPTPHDAQIVADWASVIDSEQLAEGYHSERTASGPLRPLINWANQNFPGVKRPYDVQGFRWAFRDRLVTTPGVITSPADSLGTSLVIENEKVVSKTPKLAELQKQLDDLWLTPGGDEIEFAMLKWKWANELSAGFYNDLRWPEASKVDAAVLQRSKDHHALQQIYHKELRSWFNSRPHKPGLDTPMLIGADMARHGAENVGHSLFTTWRAMKDADFPDRIERDSVPVRVCDYKLRAAIGWMKRHVTNGGIVWVHHQEIGQWLYELASAEGLPVVHCPAGDTANRFLTAEGAAGRCQGKFLICSTMAHGEGKNLQFMVDQLFVQLPMNEAKAQQAIGRTHRTGQLADTVTVTLLISNLTDQMHLAACLNDSIFVYETFQSARKMLIATWNPMPTVYGTHVLHRAGLQSKVLTAKQQLMLAERFGRSSD